MARRPALHRRSTQPEAAQEKVRRNQKRLLERMGKRFASKRRMVSSGNVQRKSSRLNVGPTRQSRQFVLLKRVVSSAHLQTEAAPERKASQSAQQRHRTAWMTVLLQCRTAWMTVFHLHRRTYGSTRICWSEVHQGLGSLHHEEKKVANIRATSSNQNKQTRRRCQ